MEKHFYVQEHEVFGDSSRVIWTSEPCTRQEAKEMRAKLADASDGDTWFNVVRDYEEKTS